jgi:ribosomal protein L32
MAIVPATAMGPISRIPLRRALVPGSVSSTISSPLNVFTTTITIPAISINIPGILSDIWEGVLRAVPKKKTSHMKKRHRQLAGKALKDVKAINTCPGCGKPKKSHTLCPYCMAGKLE